MAVTKFSTKGSALTTSEMDDNLDALASGLGPSQSFSVGELRATRATFGPMNLLPDRAFEVSSSAPTSGPTQYGVVINPTLPNTMTSAAFGLYLALNVSSGATLSNAYSLYVDANTGDGNNVTRRWGIYQATPGISNHFASALLIGTTTDNGLGTVQAAGNIMHAADNMYSFGTAGYRASVVYAGSGSINTSDAREKTAVAPLAENEIAAAKALAAEIGRYQFLTAVAAKGSAARHHIGMTVQRAIEIMTSHGLDPLVYGFICHDEWDDLFVDHAAIEAVAAQPGQPAEYETRTIDESVIVDGVAATIQRQVLVCTKEAIPAVVAAEGKPAWREQVRVAGDRYSFRPDELLLFIARGFEARIAALEASQQRG